MDNYNAIRENSLFGNLSQQDFEKVLEISRETEIEQDHYIVREGDLAESFYFILEGQVAVTKTDSTNQREHVIASLNSGETIGEMALLDHKPRSASVKAIVPTKILSIPLRDFEKLAEKVPSINKILLLIAENISGRVRKANALTVEALEKQLEEYKLRTTTGLFMVNVITALCVFSFFLSWLTKQQEGALASTAITVPLTIGFLLLFFSIIKGSNLPLSTFGLTTLNWRKAIIESVFFTIILCLIIELLKWILIQITERYMGHSVFEPYLTINMAKSSTTLTPQQLWWMIFAIYWIVVTPLQELITRGGLQGPLQRLLTGKYAVFKAIVISNLMFATAHLFLGAYIALMVFFAGLYFGWLYSRHQTLIGVILAHGLLGTWATMIIGI